MCNNGVAGLDRCVGALHGYDNHLNRCVWAFTDVCEKIPKGTYT